MLEPCAVVVGPGRPGGDRRQRRGRAPLTPDHGVQRSRGDPQQAPQEQDGVVFSRALAEPRREPTRARLEPSPRSSASTLRRPHLVEGPAIGERLPDVLGVGAVGTGEVGDRARDLQHTIEPTPRQGRLVHGIAEESLRPRRERHMPPSGGRRQMRVARDPKRLVTGRAGVRGPSITRSRTADDGSPALAPSSSCFVRRGHEQLQVDPIEQRAADSFVRGTRASASRGRCSASARRREPARARIRRSHEREPRRELDGAARAVSRRSAVLERLAQRLEASRRNSVSSSRNSTPRCARLTSPGRRTATPPPSSPGVQTVWCGARNGRCATARARRAGRRPNGAASPRAPRRS